MTNPKDGGTDHPKALPLKVQQAIRCLREATGGSMKHTKEPWEAVDNLELSPGGSWVLMSGRVMLAEIFQVKDSWAGRPTNEPESSANAARIVACVNALTGIEDPAAFVERAKKSLGVEVKPETRREGE